MSRSAPESRRTRAAEARDFPVFSGLFFGPGTIWHDLARFGTKFSAMPLPNLPGFSTRDPHSVHSARKSADSDQPNRTRPRIQETKIEFSSTLKRETAYARIRNSTRGTCLPNRKILARCRKIGRNKQTPSVQDGGRSAKRNCPLAGRPHRQRLRSSGESTGMIRSLSVGNERVLRQSSRYGERRTSSSESKAPCMYGPAAVSWFAPRL